MDAYLLECGWSRNIRIAKIKIISINENDLFPVRYEYKHRSYKGMVFTARMSEVEII